MSHHTSTTVVALGVSGDWSVSVDQSTETSGDWFLHLESRSMDAYIGISGPMVVDQLATFMEPSAKITACNINSYCRLLRDDEFDDRCFLLLGLKSSPEVVRFSLVGESLAAFHAALNQARDELVSEGVLA